MIVSLSQLYESAGRTHIYFIILDRKLSLQPDGVAGPFWNSTQIGIWASKGQMIAVQNPQFIPGIHTTFVEVVSFHQAYLVKPDLSGLILHQHKSRNGILINTLQRKSLSIVVKRTRDAICLSENASLDRIAERLMEGKTTLQQLIDLQRKNGVVDCSEKRSGEAELIELVMLPRGVLFRPLEQSPVWGG